MKLKERNFPEVDEPYYEVYLGRGVWKDQLHYGNILRVRSTHTDEQIKGKWVFCNIGNPLDCVTVEDLKMLVDKLEELNNS